MLVFFPLNARVLSVVTGRLCCARFNAKGPSRHAHPRAGGHGPGTPAGQGGARIGITGLC